LSPWVAIQFTELGSRGYLMISRTLTYLVFSLLLSFVLIDGARAQQSKLPPCPTNVPSIKWNKCFGTLKNGKSTTYVGEWQNGKANGQGTATYANGDKYVGEFKDGKPNGQGTDTFVNGDKYVGEYKDDKKNGQGTFTWADGHKYEGTFKDDNLNGPGILYAANGSIIKLGIFENGVLMKK